MVGSPLREGVFAWVKGIGSKFRILCLGIWSLEEKAGKEPMQEKDSGVKLTFSLDGKKMELLYELLWF